MDIDFSINLNKISNIIKIKNILTLLSFVILFTISLQSTFSINIIELKINSSDLTNISENNLELYIKTNNSQNLSILSQWYKNDNLISQTEINNESKDSINGNYFHKLISSGDYYILTNKNYLQKYNSSNSLIFNKSTITNYSNIKIDSSENIYISNQTIFHKFNSSGTKLIDLSINSSGIFEVDSSNNIYIISYNQNDSTIKKFNSLGNSILNSTIENTTLTNILSNTNDEIYTIGYQSTSNSTYSNILYKYNSSNNLTNNKTIQNNIYSIPNSKLILDSSENIIISTQYLNSNSEKSLIINRYDSLLIFINQFEILTNSIQNLYQLSIDNYNNLFFITSKTINSISSSNIYKYTINGNPIYSKDFSRLNSSFKISSFQIFTNLTQNILGNYNNISNTVYTNIKFNPTTQINNVNTSQQNSQLITNLNKSNNYTSSDIIKTCINLYQTTNISNFQNLSCSNELTILDNPHINLISYTPQKNSFFPQNHSINISININSTYSINDVTAILDMPNSSSTLITLSLNNSNIYQTTYNLSNLTGTYNLTFNISDIYGKLNNSVITNFTTVKKITKFLNFPSSKNKSINLTIKTFQNGNLLDEIKNINSTTNFSLQLTNTTVDLQIIGYTDKFTVTLHNINLNSLTTETIGFDSHTLNSDFLKIYGVKNEYNITNATVKIDYSDLTYIDESNLQIYKCNNYSFVNQKCNQLYALISENISQDTTNNYFEFYVTSFSSFGIFQATQNSSSPSSSSQIWATHFCEEYELYSEETNKCESLIVEFEFPEILDLDIIPSEKFGEVPDKLFDITFELHKNLITSINDLSAILTFTSFGSSLTPVKYKFTLIDSTGKILKEYDGYIEVLTENVILEDFEDFKLLNLTNGDYQVIFKTTYNVDVYDEFIQDFTIESEPSTPIFKKIFLVFGFILLIIGISFFSSSSQNKEESTLKSKESKFKSKKLLLLLLLVSQLLFINNFQLISAVEITSENGDLNFYVSGTSNSNQKISYYGEWYKNDKPLFEPTNTFTNITKTTLKNYNYISSKFDLDDNLYILSSTYDLSKNNPSGSDESLLQKYDKTGNLILELELKSMIGYNLELDTSNNIYILGSNEKNLKLKKFTNSGSIILDKTYDIDKKGFISSTNLILDSNNNIFGTMDFTEKSDKNYIFKISNSGELEKLSKISDALEKIKLDVDSKGNIFTMYLHKGSKKYLIYEYNQDLNLNNKYSIKISKPNYKFYDLIIGIDNKIYMAYADGNSEIIVLKKDLDFTDEWEQKVYGSDLENKNFILDHANNIYLSYSEDNNLEIEKFSSNGEEILSIENNNLSLININLDINNDGELFLLGNSILDNSYQVNLNKYESGFIKQSQSSGKNVLVDSIEKELTTPGDLFKVCVSPYVFETYFAVGSSKCSSEITIVEQEIPVAPLISNYSLNSLDINSNDKIDLKLSAFDKSGIKSALALIKFENGTMDEFLLPEINTSIYSLKINGYKIQGNYSLVYVVTDNTDVISETEPQFFQITSNDYLKINFNSLLPLANSSININDTVNFKLNLTHNNELKSVKVNIISQNSSISSFILNKESNSILSNSVCNSDTQTNYAFGIDENGVVYHEDSDFTGNWGQLCMDSDCGNLVLNDNRWEYGFGIIEGKHDLSFQIQDDTRGQCRATASNVEVGSGILNSNCYFDSSIEPLNYIDTPTGFVFGIDLDGTVYHIDNDFSGDWGYICVDNNCQNFKYNNDRWEYNMGIILPGPHTLEFQIQDDEMGQCRTKASGVMLGSGVTTSGCIGGTSKQISSSCENLIDYKSLYSSEINLSSQSGNLTYTFEVTDITGKVSISKTYNISILEPIKSLILTNINISLNSPNTNLTYTYPETKNLNISGELSCDNNCQNITTNLLLLSSVSSKKLEELSDWKYKQTISYSTPQDIPNEYQVLLDLDKYEINNEKLWENNCEDVRIYSNTTELNFWIETCDPSKEELKLWFKTNNLINKNDDFSINMYYGNDKVNSNSNVEKTFIENKIHLLTGDCKDYDKCYMNNADQANYIKGQIDSNNFKINGESYVEGINDNQNAHGSDDLYFSRYRFLYIPSETKTYTFGLNGDDGQEFSQTESDYYGSGFKTLNLYNNEILSTWYKPHGQYSQCGVGGTQSTKELNKNEGYWFDYLMVELWGGQLAQLCFKQENGNYEIFDINNFNNEFFARSYIENEPVKIKVSAVEEISSDKIITNITCKNSENNKCIFNYNLEINNLISDLEEYNLVIKSYSNSNESLFTKSENINIIKLEEDISVPKLYSYNLNKFNYTSFSEIDLSIQVIDDSEIKTVFAIIEKPDKTNINISLNTLNDLDYTNIFKDLTQIGTYSLKYIATDIFDNSITSPIQKLSLLDKINPVISDYTIISKNLNTEDILELSLSGSDNVGINSAQIKITSPLKTELIDLVLNSQNNYKATYKIPNEIGHYTFEFILTDINGNINSNIQDNIKIIDNINPTIVNQIELPETLHTEEIVIFNLTTFDNIEIKSVQLILNSPSNIKTYKSVSNSVDNIYNLSYTLPNELGLYNYYFKIIDSSDNFIESNKYTFEIKDNIYPEIKNINSISNNVSTGDNLFIQISGIDNTGIKSAKAKIKYPNGKIIELNLNSSSTEEYSSYLQLPELIGTYEILYELIDFGGNKVISETEKFIAFDNTPPQSTNFQSLNNQSLNSEKLIINSQLPLFIQGSDNVKLEEIYAIITDPNNQETKIDLTDLENNSIYSNSYTIPNTLGNFLINYYLIDSSLNSYISPTQRFSTLDKDLPEFETLSNLSGNQIPTNTKINLSIIAKDNIQIENVVAKIKLDNNYNYTKTLSKLNTDTFNSEYTIPEKLGKYTIQYIITDTSGNQIITNEQEFTGIDTKIPEIKTHTTYSQDVPINTQLEFNITSIDNIKIKDTYLKIIDNLGGSNIIKLDLINNITYSTLYKTPESIGKLTFEYYIYDTSDNLAQISGGEILLKDNTKPSILKNEIQNTQINTNQIQTFELLGSDNLEILKTKLVITSPTNENISYEIYPFSENAFYLDYNIENNIGTYKYQYTLYDTSLNYVTSDIKTFQVIDKQVPQIISTSKINQTLLTSETIELFLSGTDNVDLENSFVTITLPDKTTNNINLNKITDSVFTNNYKIPELIGDYSLIYSLSDSSSNNILSSTSNFTVLDKVEPEVVSYTNLKNKNLNIGDHITLDLNAIDNIGLKNVKVIISNPNGIKNEIQLEKTNNNFYQINYTIPNYLGNFQIEYIIIDTSNNQKIIPSQTFTTFDTIMPEFEILSNKNLTTVSTVSKINLSIIAKDNIEIKSVEAILSLPNNNIITVTLTNENNTFNSNYLLPELIGDLKIQYLITDSSNNKIFSEFKTIEIIDIQKPKIINYTIPSKQVYEIGSNISLNLKGSDNIKITRASLLITDSNNQTKILPLKNNINDSYELIYTVPDTIGINSIQYQLFDSSNNSMNSEYIEFLITDYKFDFETGIIDSNNSNMVYSINIFEDSDLLLSKENLTSSSKLRLKNSSVDIEYITYGEIFKLKLNNISLNKNIVKKLEINQIVEKSSNLITYYVEDININYESAYLEINYQNLKYTNVDNLRLARCNNYNFEKNICNDDLEIIDSSIIQNKLTNTFNILTNKLGIFTILELPEPETENNKISYGGKKFYGNFCNFGYIYENSESKCINKSYNIQKEIKIDYSNEVFTQPLKDLFDIKFEILSQTINSEKDLIGRVTFENFGDKPTFVDLDAKIYSDTGTQIGEFKKTVLIQTESVLIIDSEDFKSLDLFYGNYSMVISTNYGNNINDHFIQKFEYPSNDITIPYVLLSTYFIIFLVGTFLAFRITKNYNPLGIKNKTNNKNSKIKVQLNKIKTKQNK
jgi:hypothetical protein